MGQERLENLKTDLGRIQDYIDVAKDRIQDEIDEVVLVPEPVAPPPVGIPSWSMHGKPLPSRHFPEFWDGPRTSLYGLQLVGGEHHDLVLHGCISACLTMAGGATARNVILFNSDKDALKIFWGDATIEDFHFWGLGYSTNDPHADGVQGRGGVGTVTFRRGFFDQPSNEGGGTHSNSCAIIDNAIGAGGNWIFEEVIFRGGNTVLDEHRKGSSVHPMAEVRLKRCTFVVEFNSPRYTLVRSEGGFEYDECEVVFYNRETGLCELLYQGDPRQFDAKAWHIQKFGVAPAN